MPMVAFWVNAISSASAPMKPATRARAPLSGW